MHYIGVLFGGCLEVLEDYYEGLEVESYVYKSKEEMIADYIEMRKRAIKWRREKIKANDPKSSEYQKWINEHPKYTKKSAWKDIKKDYEGQLDEDDNILSTYNPNSEWDWYSIGGRWSGYFPLKEKDENGDLKYCDEALIEEIDWDTYFKDRKAPYCYITEGGEWIAKGDIGWFTSSNEMDTDAWQLKFKKELNSYPKDTEVIAIDFHI